MSPKGGAAEDTQLVVTPVGGVMYRTPGGLGFNMRSQNNTSSLSLKFSLSSKVGKKYPNHV